MDEMKDVLGMPPDWRKEHGLEAERAARKKPDEGWGCDPGAYGAGAAPGEAAGAIGAAHGEAAYGLGGDGPVMATRAGSCGRDEVGGSAREEVAMSSSGIDDVNTTGADVNDEEMDQRMNEKFDSMIIRADRAR